MNEKTNCNIIRNLGLEAIDMIKTNKMTIRPGPVDKEIALIRSIKLIRDTYKKDWKKTVSVVMKDDKSGYIERLNPKDNTINIDFLSVNALKDKIKEAIKDGIEGYCIWLPADDGKYMITVRDC